MVERGIKVDHTTIYRWVQAYAPELDKRIRPHLNPTNDSWKVDETYIKVKKEWKYLYRAIDSQGNTLDFMLSAKRDAKAAQRFFKKVLGGQHTDIPRVINVDKNPAYPLALKDLKAEKVLPQETELRQFKYFNNLINTARRTIQGYEGMNMIRKGQIKGVEKGDVLGQISFIKEIFGLAA
jgi:transposase-like protein